MYSRLVGLCFLLCASATAQKTKPITAQNYRAFHGDGSPASLDDIIESARQVSVTFLGETHDDAVAHYLEAEILKRVVGPQWALSLEMFERDVQGVLDEYLQGVIEEKDVVSSGRAWSNYRSDYAPLVRLAKESHIPVIAANAPKRYVDLVNRKGQTALLALSIEAKRTLPTLPYAAASPAYRERFEREMRGDTGPKGPPKTASSPNPAHAMSEFVMEAQSLWDATMADSIASYLNLHPDGHVLEVNGAFHSEYHQGILEHLGRERPRTTSVVVTIVREKSFPAWKDDNLKRAGDFVILTDPKVRPNPVKKR